MDLLLLALLVAMGAVAARAARRGWKRRQWRALRAAEPGYSADWPVQLTSSRVVDEVVQAARCECGGRVKNRGETPRLGLRVVRGQCVDCEREVELFFVVPQLLN